MEHARNSPPKQQQQAIQGGSSPDLGIGSNRYKAEPKPITAFLLRQIY
jgi:hypothetical protein